MRNPKELIEMADAKQETPVPSVLPLEVIDKSIGKQVKVLLTTDKEFQGTLAGFDDFVNVVLENVTEIDNDGPKPEVIKRMLLNGGQIAMINTQT